MSEQEPPTEFVDWYKARYAPSDENWVWKEHCLAEWRINGEIWTAGQRAQAEKDAEIAHAEMVSGETGDAGDVGYNRACEDIESAIRAAAPKGGE